MNRNLLILTAMMCLMLASCGRSTPGEKRPAGRNDTVMQPGSGKQGSNDIIRASATGSDGTKLEMVFDNAKRTVAITLKGETFVLKQDTMASGIRYSNKNYCYSEWHDQIEVKKDGKTIFRNF